MLAAGGSAVDAILATAITLTLVEPVSNGIGSDAYAIVWDGKQLHGLNASGRSPAAWTPEYFAKARQGAGARLELGQRAGLRVGLGRPAREIRQAAVREAVRAGDPLRARRLPGLADHRQAVGGAGAGAEGAAGLRRGLPAGRAARRRSGEVFTFPDHAATLEKIAATQGRGLLRGRARREDRGAREAARRRDARVGPRRAQVRLGRHARSRTTAATPCTRSRPTARASSR